MFFRYISFLAAMLFSVAAVADERAHSPDSVEWRLAGYAVVGIVNVIPERRSMAILEKGSEHKTVRIGENLRPGLRVAGMDNDKVLFEYRGGIVGLLLSPSAAPSSGRYTSNTRSSQNREREKPGWVDTDSRYDSARSHSFARQRAAAARQRITSKDDPETSSRPAQPVKLDEIRDPEKFGGLIDNDRL